MRKTLALLLALMLCLSLMPTAAAIDRAVYADQIKHAQDAAQAESVTPRSFTTASSDNGDADYSGVSFNPYVFTVDEKAAVSASVQLQPRLMAVTSEVTETPTESSAPTNFKVDDIIKNSTFVSWTLGWDAQEGADTYELSVYVNNKTCTLSEYNQFTISNKVPTGSEDHMFSTVNGRSTFTLSSEISDSTEQIVDGIANFVRPGDTVIFVIETMDGKQSNTTFTISGGTYYDPSGSNLSGIFSPNLRLDDMFFVDNNASQTGGVAYGVGSSIFTNCTGTFTTNISGNYTYSLFSSIFNGSAISSNLNHSMMINGTTFNFLTDLNGLSNSAFNLTLGKEVHQIVDFSGSLNIINANFTDQSAKYADVVLVANNVSSVMYSNIISVPIGTTPVVSGPPYGTTPKIIEASFADGNNATVSFRTTDYDSQYYLLYGLTDDKNGGFEMQLKSGTYYKYGQMAFYPEGAGVTVQDVDGKYQIVTLSFAMDHKPKDNETVYFAIKAQNSGMSKPFAVRNGIPITSDNLTIALHSEGETYYYNGSQIKPEVLVYETSTQIKLMQDKDFTVTYGENVNAGPKGGSVTVFGIGAYTGYSTLVFPIEALPLDNENVTMTVDPANYTYTGENINASVILMYNGATLEEGADYTLDFSDNLNVGTASVKAIGKGNFSGSRSANFTIDPLELTNSSSVTVELAAYTGNYTGEPINMTVVVTVISSSGSSRTLEEDKDYSVSYSNNTDVGNATVTVIGISPNLTGNVSLTFEIVDPLQEIKEKIKKLPEPENITFSDVEEVGAVYLEYLELSEEQQALVDKDTDGKLLKCVQAIIDMRHPILEGENQTWTGTGNVTIRIDADCTLLVSVALDATKLVPGTDYEAVNGSTILTLFESFLKTLNNGVYDFYAIFEDGYAYTTLTIDAAQNQNVGPKPYIPWFPWATTPTKPTTPTPTTPETKPALPFTDVDPLDSIYKYIKFVYEKGLMNGVSDTTFDLYGTLTRGMLMTVLYRIEGSPAVQFAGKFSDVPAGIWYSDAIEWAASVGIANGYTDGRFGPNDPVTREQLAAFLYRYANWKGYPINTGALNIDDFDKISAYAVDSVKWAVENDMLWIDDDAVRPTEAARRWEIAVAMFCLFENIVK